MNNDYMFEDDEFDEGVTPSSNENMSNDNKEDSFEDFKKRYNAAYNTSDKSVDNQAGYSYTSYDSNESSYNNSYAYYSQQAQYTQPEAGKGMAVTSFVLGLLSLVFFLSGLNVIAGIVSIILGAIFVASKRNKKANGYAIVGIIASVISICLFIASWTYVFSNMDNIAEVSKELLNTIENENQTMYFEYNLDDTL